MHFILYIKHQLSLSLMLSERVSKAVSAIIWKNSVQHWPINSFTSITFYPTRKVITPSGVFKGRGHNICILDRCINYHQISILALKFRQILSEIFFRYGSRTELVCATVVWGLRDILSFSKCQFFNTKVYSDFFMPKAPKWQTTAKEQNGWL